MGIEIRLPSITGITEKEQLAQLKSYLFQLREQLQWAFDNISVAGGGTGYTVNQAPINTSPRVISSYDADVTFSSIKSLIIKSADIVDAYYEEINRRLEGVYVAQSDFGSYAEQTAQEIEANSTNTIQRFENIQVLITGLDSNVKNIDGSLVTIGEDLSYQENRILTINNNLEEIGSNVTQLEVDISDLDSTIQNTKIEMEGTISNVDTELKQIVNTTKTELQGNVDTVKSKLEGDITNVEASLSNNIENAKSTLNTDIEKAKAALNTDIENAKSEANSKIENAKSEVNSNIASTKTELEGDINNAKTELSGMVGGVNEDLQNTKEDVTGRINATNGNVASLNEGLSGANEKIDDIDGELQAAKQDMNESIQGVAESVSEVSRLLDDAKKELSGSLDGLEFSLEGLRQLVIGVTAYVKSGLLYSTEAGIPVYGIEIGQTVTNETTGEEAFNKYARFTSEKLSFYDANGIEVAYISDKKLFIRIAEITISLKIGGLISLVMTNGDVVDKWVGGNA